MGIPAGLGYRSPDGATLYQLDVWPSPEGEWPLHPFCIEETIRENSRRHHESCCPYMILVLMLDGGLTYRCGDADEFDLLAGHALVIPQGSGYSFRSMPSKRYRKLVLEIKGSQLKNISEALRLDHPFLFKPDDFQALADRLRALVPLIQGEREADLPLVLGMTYEIMAAISTCARKREPKAKQLLLKAKAYLENPPDEKFTIAMLAVKLGVCQSLLDKVFRQELGLSPQEYRMAMRFEKAKLYLESSSMPLKVIALRLGYANQLYFSNDFKRRSGVSPRDYRASATEKT